MAATSQQMVMSQDQAMQDAIASIASLSSSGHATAKRNSSGNSVTHSPARSTKSERRPSFTITLPPSSSRNSLLNTKSIPILDEEENNPDAAESTCLSNMNSRNSTRRPSVHFPPGEEFILLSHEAKHGLPKTPYPTTGEEDERIQSSLFKC
ncbi:hypothetical protein B0O80DRAFT_496268 [Mortierella sp. GBAus27b]|nr:hypothetical protein B0O80DRAFT_496268 [Mortierella sp. GBAus27b]